jgi:hypothetical protein
VKLIDFTLLIYYEQVGGILICNSLYFCIALVAREETRDGNMQQEHLDKRHETIPFSEVTVFFLS